MKLRTDVIAPAAFRLLKDISRTSKFHDFYLAGGTALALQIGHRKSEDLDFFTDVDFSSNIIHEFPGSYEIINLQNNLIELISNQTKVMFMYYGFKKYKVNKIISNLRFADPVDIGLMKLLALQGRTTKKDIIDLYFIHKKIIPLNKILDIFERHHPKDSFSSYSSFKSLYNLDDVDSNVELITSDKVDFEECFELVRTYLNQHIHKLIS